MVSEEYIKNKVRDTLDKMTNKSLVKKCHQFQLVDIPFISIIRRQDPLEISKKKLRLFLDIMEAGNPGFSELSPEDKAAKISTIFKCMCNEKDVERLKSFKQIVSKSVITIKNGNVTEISRLRWRGRDNLQKNIIHFLR